jgi:hypothetical protein
MSKNPIGSDLIPEKSQQVLNIESENPLGIPGLMMRLWHNSPRQKR